ncbi:PREDICTED: RAB6A-GEF complex partner protein 2-like [Amphimedon queenslandica]|uniref:Uncharacterized protein n=1 Tax=Amphimedon queenslandica TaxID=400682 RepID=A0AAN0IVE6_AMPQE|nr:PREDICTED: RAB6A-GEF complex partner protein 2-like [Amphimedon queenslandica]|eukprot:XP_011410006.1 PREDICTED: RAB6A-GEF complex partner protein 2-like [Amphimedon queenslandica]
MAEVTVRVDSNGAFVAGDTLQCQLIFSNKDTSPQTIAWVGAQIHCQRLVRESVLKLKASEQLSSPITETAFFPNRGERGSSILSTRSTVLLCNVTINPSETKTVSYTEIIPLGGPPSFHGHIVRYVYKLAVGVQKPNCPAQITRLPIRVIQIPDHLRRPLLASPQISNPFLVSEECESASELGLEAIALESCKRSTASFTLTASGECIGRVVVPRTSYRLGDEVTAIFDCSLSVHPVLQVTASLVYIETINKECVLPSVTLKPVVTQVAQQTKSCTNSLITHYSLPVPPTLAQSFSDSTVKLHWEIQFHLLISRGLWTNTHTVQQSLGPGGGVAELWSGPSSQNVDTIDWCLPVTMLPTLYSEDPMPQQTLQL